jgi:hypothetical protein
VGEFLLFANIVLPIFPLLAAVCLNFTHTFCGGKLTVKPSYGLPTVPKHARNNVGFCHAVPGAGVRKTLYNHKGILPYVNY